MPNRRNSPNRLFRIALPIVLALAGRSAVADAEHSKQLFLEAAKVFQSPRCLNCHPRDDRPHQGDDMHVHQMNIQRGPVGLGMPAAQCNACHNDRNFDGSGVPGAPHWRLAPASMAWQGLSAREICLQLKDPSRNGGKTLEQLIEHNAKDELVAWGWAPGGKRTPAPGSQKAFGETFAQWVHSGAACPD